MKSKLPKIDNVIVLPSAMPDRSTLVDVLQRAFDHIGELAEANQVQSPLTICLSDADERRLLTMTIILTEDGWKGRVTDGEMDSRGGIAFPWFILLQDDAGRTFRIRVELDPQSRLM